MNSTTSIRAVFFDAVGTLLTPAVPVSATYRAVAQRHGADLDEATIRARLRESFENQERLDYQAGWRSSEPREAQRWRSIVSETLCEVADPDGCFLELWQWYRAPAAWSVHPEAGAVLSKLADRGLVLGIASNFDARLTGIVAASPELALLAERCVISSIVGWRKPSREFFREVIIRAGYAAPETIFVGDDFRNDFEGAQNAGLRALLFDPAGKADVPEKIRSLTEVLVYSGA